MATTETPTPIPSTAPIKERGIFESIGGVAGLAYGIYFAHTHKSAWWTYLVWAVIFGLAFHEIGEQADRVMKKVS